MMHGQKNVKLCTAVYIVTTTLKLLQIQPNISFPRLSELIFVQFDAVQVLELKKNLTTIKLPLSAPRRHTAPTQLHSYTPSALGGGQRSTNYTPRSLCSREGTPSPIEQEAKWVSEPVWAFWRRNIIS
jgi:hypothetical protein